MKLKNKLVIVLVLIILLSFCFVELQAENFTADLPVIITSAGQSETYKNISFFAEKFGVKVKQSEGIINQSNLKDINTLAAVIGINYDKLKQVNLNLKTEIKRINNFLAAAESQGVKIIGIYVEDKLTDAELCLIGEVGRFSDYFIIKRPDENNGDTITKLMEEQEINYILINQAVNAGSELNKILIEPYS